MVESMNLDNLDLEYLMRRTFDLAYSARTKGNHPFGALLCDLSGTIVLEAENSVGEFGDVTNHAERNLVSKACRRFSREERMKLVMITSTEPCAMCAGAAFWAGIRGVVFGLPEKELVKMCVTPESPYPQVLDLECKKIFDSCPHHPTIVIGPILEQEAKLPHKGFWARGY